MKDKSMIRALAFLVPFAVAAPAFAADCTPTLLEVQSGRIYVAYDPFLNQDTSSPVSLDVQPGDCEDSNINFEIVSVDDPTAAAARGYEVASQLRVDFVDPQGRSFSNWALPGERARPRSGSRVPLSDVFRVLVRRGQAAPPGTYQSQFLLRTLAEDGTVQSERPFTLVLETLASVRVGSPLTMLDFGTLEAGESVRLPMNTFANVTYEVRVDSERGWRLRSDENVGDGVPYSVWLQNTRLDGQSAAPVAVEPGANGFRPLELGVRIEPFSSQPAGTYRDYITIEVTPLS